MSKQLSVGFSHRIQLEWLELTAKLLLAGSTRNEIKTILDEVLRDKLSVGNHNRSSSRAKAISILLKIWVAVPESLQPLRNEGLEYLRTTPLHQHLVIHWGMTMAAYPFFGLVAETVGRLLRLQGAVAAATVQRRIKEKLGERETVSRATRYVLRCFVDWGVLEDTTEKGVYQPVKVQFIDNKELAAWLIEAALVASHSDLQALGRISQTPALFPFTVSPLNMRDLEGHQRLELFRQGLDENMVMLRR